VTRDPTSDARVRIIGTGQAHTHQHVSAAPSLTEFGAKPSVERARNAAGITLDNVRYAAIYDSFTITLTILLEEIGLAPRGQAGQRAREGYFNFDGTLPLNTHGGLLSYGHCGCGGAMAHLVETHHQMTGRAGPRQVKDASLALLHGDGGVLSSHVSLVLEAQ
jgi:acetyl-CoA acetyltransferase